MFTCKAVDVNQTDMYHLGHLEMKCGEILVNKNQLFTYLCTKCLVLFIDIEEFIKHIKRYHLNMITLNNKKLTKQNTNNTASTESYSSRGNKEDFNNKNNNLPQPIVKLKRLKLFKCEFCKTIRFTASGLKIHTEKYHQNHHLQQKNQEQSISNKNIEKNIITTNTREKDKKFLFRCSFCKKIYNTKHSIIQHLEIVHNSKDITMYELLSNQNTILGKRQDLLVCKYCNIKFRKEQNLIKHEYLHTGKKYDCKFCKKRFRLKEAFTNHMKDHQGNP